METAFIISAALKQCRMKLKCSYIGYASIYLVYDNTYQDIVVQGSSIFSRVQACT